MKLRLALFMLAIAAAAFAAQKLPAIPPQIPAMPSGFPDIVNLTSGILANGSASALANNLSSSQLPRQIVSGQQIAGGSLLDVLQMFLPGFAPSNATLPSASAASVVAQAGNTAATALPIAQFRELILLAIILSYVFAAGKIADFLQSSGKPINKREALSAPFAYMLVSAFGVIIYFSSGAWVPPQITIITLAFYLLALPLGFAIGLGALVLYAFFRDRLNPVQALDLSMRIMLAPLFDGIAGYWTALGAAAILVLISGLVAYSSGLNAASVALDFLILSAVASLYFLYRAFTAKNNEGRAGGLVTSLTLLAPGVLRLYFKELVCAGLSRIPLQIFHSCPLEQVGNEVTLAFSVLATLVILVPAIPFIYAFVVNLLRFLTLLELLMAKPKKAVRADEGRENE